MQKYFLVLKLSLADIFEYRFDFLIHALKYSFAVVMMALIWLAVIKETPIAGFSAENAVRYYIFAAIIYSLSNFHTWYLEADIKEGGLTKHILKPVNPFWYYFFFQTVHSGVEMFLKVLILPTLLFLFGFSVVFSVSQFIVFALYLPVIFFFSDCLYMTISYLAFWMKEVFAVRLTVMITIRFLSGVLVPVSFFPQVVQDVLQFLPFQYLTYMPIQIIENKVTTDAALRGLGILCFWSVLVFLLNRYVWRKGMYAYEGGNL